MPEHPTTAHPDQTPRADVGDAPPPEIEEFIRFCHARRAAEWPELYDEMCAVAARGEFNGWGHDQFADHGLTFALSGMPRLAGWVRATLGPGRDAMELHAGIPHGG
jgi:hypothetical protein